MLIFKLGIDLLLAAAPILFGIILIVAAKTLVSSGLKFAVRFVRYYCDVRVWWNYLAGKSEKKNEQSNT